MNFLHSMFDIDTLRLLSLSGPDASMPKDGEPVFISGKKVPLYNVYDAIEMALKDELLTTISDQPVVNTICDLLLDDLVRFQDEARDDSDFTRWCSIRNITAACSKEFVLPKQLIARLSLRLRNCFARVRKVTSSEDIKFS